MQDDSEQEKNDLPVMPDGAPTIAQHIPEKLVFKSSKFGYRVIETLIFSAGSLVGGILGAYGGAASQQEGTVITRICSRLYCRWIRNHVFRQAFYLT